MFQSADKKQTFTILELLITIGVLILLSIVVFVGIKWTIQSVKEASALRLSNMIHKEMITDLVGGWTFDKGQDDSCVGKVADVCDSSKKGNHGIRKGSTTQDDFWSRGKIGQAGNFNGKDDYVDCGDSFSLGSNAVTIEVWFKTDTISSVWQFISGRSNYWSSNDYGIHLRYSGLEFFVDSCRDSDYFTIIQSDWYHAVGVYDGDKRKLYVNGKLEFESDCRGKSINNSFKFTIGGDNEGEYPFNGMIDEVYIYNKALSFSEIKNLYAKGLQEIHANPKAKTQKRNRETF